MGFDGESCFLCTINISILLIILNQSPSKDTENKRNEILFCPKRGKTNPLSIKAFFALLKAEFYIVLKLRDLLWPFRKKIFF